MPRPLSAWLLAQALAVVGDELADAVEQHRTGVCSWRLETGMCPICDLPSIQQAVQAWRHARDTLQ